MQQPNFLFFASASVLLSALPAVSAPDPQSTTYENCKQVSPAVVTIYAGTEIGSGSIISADGTIITNHHVLQEVIQSQGKKLIYVTLPNGGHYTAQLLSTDISNDLALVKLNTQETFPTVPLAETVAIQPSESVCAIGSPLGKRGVLSQGKFGGYRENGDLKSKIFLYPGNSGGPLLNPEGKMIGINKSIWESSTGKNTGISFATSVAIARQFMTKNGVALPLPPTAAQSQEPAAIATELPPPPMIEPLPVNLEPAPVSSEPVSVEPVSPEPAAAPTTQSLNLIDTNTDLSSPPFVLSAEIDASGQVRPIKELVFTSSSEPAVTPAPEPQLMQRPTQPESVSSPSFTPVAAVTPQTSPTFAGRLGAIINPQSLIVRQVEFDSPAERAGLQPGDRLVAINGDYIQGLAQLQSLLRQRPSSAVFVIDRNQEFSSIQVNWLAP